MSAATKLILAIIVLALLIGGWLFMNKSNEDSMVENTAPQTEETVDTGSMTPVTDGTPSVLSLDDVSDAGEVKLLPADPLLGERGVGDPNAPIKIQEFFSLTCNHCADFHTGTYQALKSKYIDTGIVYYVYEEFPLNGPALYGSMIARCLPTGRYVAFVDLLLRTQEAWAFSGDFKGALLQNAKLAGMSEEEFNTCFENKELQKSIANSISAASDAFNISSTPSFVVNDGERIIRGGKSIEAFDVVIEALLPPETE